MSNGWIKLHRKIEDSIIFSNEKGLKIWIWCLLRAGHKQKSVFLGRSKITLLPGQFVTGSNTMEEELNLGKSTIWYWLRILEKEGQVGIKTTNKYSVITIPNWAKYQEVGNKEEADGKQMGTNKNDKNDKNSFQEVVQQPDDDEVRVVGTRECMNAFVHINPSLRGTENKSEFAALRKLISLYGLERVLAVIKSLEHTNSIPFIVTITKPTELLRDWAKLHAQVEKKKNEINQPKTRGRGFEA